jgi:hypothetical protein
VLDRLVLELPKLYASGDAPAYSSRQAQHRGLDWRLTQHLACHPQDVVERVAVAVQVEHGAESAAGT